MQVPAEPLVTFSPETGTFTTFPSPLRDNVRPLRLDFFDAPDLAEPQPDVHKVHADASASPDQQVDSFYPLWGADSGQNASSHPIRWCRRTLACTAVCGGKAVETCRERSPWIPPAHQPPKRAPSRQEPQSQRTHTLAFPTHPSTANKHSHRSGHDEAVPIASSDQSVPASLAVQLVPQRDPTRPLLGDLDAFQTPIFGLIRGPRMNLVNAEI
ncbi:hypothetical protein N7516_005652 [Penicillium verrucosum]|uniref:uncharacterized protein n=1 Tax=Penicillium verrucosum TaxID=60171 RepID=UPI002545404C|nr:uncharacterized protein N7516_005652 [Penicillium verrucosum]KAJ5945484.1 hypothetical protein N7516_005652 [Penicillium verrucosum]